MDIKALKAIACKSRLKILEYLKEPAAHFVSQDGFDVTIDGVGNKLITKKLGISQESVTAHMRSLVDAGLVSVTKVGTHRLYKVNLDHVAAVLHQVSTTLLVQREPQASAPTSETTGANTPRIARHR